MAATVFISQLPQLFELLRHLPWVAVERATTSVAEWAVTAVWQGTLLAAALGITLRFAPRVSARQRFLAYAAGFLAVLILPFLIESRTAAPSRPEPAGALLPSAWFHLDIRWGIALMVVWLGLSAYRVSALAVHTVKLRRLWLTARPVSAQLAPVVAERMTIGGRQPVELCLTAELERPSVIGFFAPRILVPDWLFERLTPAELDQIVLHEVEHLRRGDDWTNLIQKLAMALFSIHPGLAWLEHKLSAEREMACDEAVLRVTRAPRAYAACLAALAERRLQHRTQALTLGAWSARTELADRVHTILAHRRTLEPAAAGVLLSVLGCGLTAGVATLSQCPQLLAFVPAAHSEPVARARVEVPLLTAPRLLPATGNNRTNRANGAPGVTHSLSSTARKRLAPAKAAAGAGTEAMPVFAQLSQPDAHGSAGLLSKQAPQQWFMLTEWTQTAAPQVEQQVAREDAVAPAADSAAQSGTSESGAHLTLTRLIFRVIPANPQHGQSATVIEHSWLVLQL